MIELTEVEKVVLYQKYRGEGLSLIEAKEKINNYNNERRLNNKNGKRNQ